MTSILLPHNLTAKNFVSHRRDATDTRFTVHDLLMDWFAERDEDTYAMLHERARQLMREQLAARGEKLPRSGTAEDCLLRLGSKLSPKQLHRIWQSLLDL